jgi:hypothetical protein
MFRLARKFMETTGASFIASGEVVGQRPMSQQLHQLRVIEEQSGLRDILLRPLSAKLLEPTLPERLGIVDREKLYGFNGRSRRELIELAKSYGIENPPTPSTGCLLTEPDFAVKVRDIFHHNESYEKWDFETLKVGRHFRLSKETKIILGRNQEENQRLALGWDLKRALTKINYRIHTDAIKIYLIPPHISKQSTSILYATEADVLNVALFGKTAKDWRDKNPRKDGNIRDYADVTQLVVLANLEGINAELIRRGLPQSERLMQLNEAAIVQMQSLVGNVSIKKLK